jgi:hypothetical protein
MRALKGVALVAVVMSAAACASGSPGAHSVGTNKDTLTVIHAAAAATSEAQSVRFRGSMSEDMRGVTVPPAAVPVSFRFSGDFAGVMRLRPLAGQMTLFNVTSGGGALTGQVQEVVTPKGFYVKSPQLAARTGKPWAGITFDELKSQSGVDVKQFMSQAQQMQPGQYVQQLAASGNIKRVGSETINGVATTHYAGDVSTAQTLAHYASAARAELAPIMQSAGITSTHIDVWVDGSELVRRIVSSAVGAKATIKTRIDVLAYDVPVDATPPPADRVADLATLAGGG